MKSWGLCLLFTVAPHPLAHQRLTSRRDLVTIHRISKWKASQGTAQDLKSAKALCRHGCEPRSTNVTKVSISHKGQPELHNSPGSFCIEYSAICASETAVSGPSQTSVEQWTLNPCPWNCSWFSHKTVVSVNSSVHVGTFRRRHVHRIFTFDTR